MNFSKNIKIYYIYSIFSELLIIGPILVLFLIARGLSFTEIMLLQSICAISVVISEVPTGAFADKFGRKASLIIGAVCWGVSILLYVFGSSFIVFALGELIFGFGTSFKSGADSALLYDSLKSMGRENEFVRIEGKARGIVFYSQAVGSIVAGFVYKIDIFLPLIISAVFMAITIIISLLFREPPIKENDDKPGTSYFIQILDSGKYIMNHEKLKAVILYCMVFFIFFRVGYWYYQPYMESVNIPVEYFGVIFFVFNVFAAVSSHYASKIMEITKPRTLMFMSLIMIVSFALLGLIGVWIGVFAILLQQVARGLQKPVITKYINKHTPSDKRATILSFQSLAGNLSYALACPFMGLLKDNTNIYTTHIILALLMIILTYLAALYMNKRIGVKVDKNISCNV